MNIGTLIRRYRKEKKLTLKNVATAASISEGFLSQVENDVNSPSVDTLMRICEAIGINPGDLLNQANSREDLVVIRQEEWGDIELSHTGFATQRFFGPEYREVIDSSVLVLEPGATIPVRKNIRKSQEILCVLKGRIVLQLSGRDISLSKGDSAHFWSDPADQSITNNHKERSYVLWVGTL